VFSLFEAMDVAGSSVERPADAPLRLPLTGVHKIQGVGTVLTGRVMSGQVCCFVLLSLILILRFVLFCFALSHF
jgi:translation elongation factor EF-Tu-like GTPase